MGPAEPAGAGTAWDFHRSVWSAIIPRRDHQSPCRFAAPTRRMGCEGQRAFPLPRGFGRLGSVAYRPGRNVTPPELLLPGPSVTARCLRCWLHRLPGGSFEQEFPYGDGPARVGLSGLDVA